MSAPARAAPLERGAFALAGIAAIYASLLPLGAGAAGAAAPDLLFCLAFAAALRRPAGVPLVLVLALGLLADLLLLRPAGLGALALVLAVEVARERRALLLGGNGFVEWLGMAAIFAAILAATYALLVLAFAPVPGLVPLAKHWLATVIAYPFIALALAWGVRARLGRPR